MITPHLSDDLIRNRNHLGECIILVVFLLATGVIYLLTLAPGITWSNWGADGGDFIVAAVNRSLPHPPGFPIFLVFARLMTFVPFATIAFRMNVMSAIMAIGAAFFSLLTIREYNLHKWSTLAAPLCLAFSPLYWSQAIITEVYTCAAFFVSLSLYLLQRAESSQGSSLTCGFAWGLALAVHPTTVFAGFNLWFGRKKVWNGIITGVLISLLFYAGLVLWGGEPHRWADFGSVRGWITYVSGHLYWDYAFSVPLWDLPRRIISWITLYTQQFTPIGAVLVIVGLAREWQRSWQTALGFLLTVSLSTFYTVNYNSIDSFVYLVPILPLFVPYLAQGMDWIIKRGVPGSLLLLLPVILVVSQWQSISLRNEDTVERWLESTFSSAPPGALLLSNEDRHTFALWYGQEVAGLREDILVVDERLWNYTPYQRYVEKIAGESINQLSELEVSRPVCMVEDKGVVCQ